MSIPDRLLHSLCGGDSGCVERALSFLSYVDRLERLVKELPKPELSGYDPPLIERVTNLDLLESEARRVAEGDEDTVSYLVRRRVFLEHGREIQNAWHGSTCPVCGLLPTLMLYRPSDKGLFSGYHPHYRCVCGAEWPGRDWRCPRCGEEGRNAFETLILTSSLEARRCVRCSYVIPIIERETLQIHKLHLLVMLFL